MHACMHGWRLQNRKHVSSIFVYVQVQKILQSSQQKEGLELQNLLTNPHVQVRYLYHIKCT